MENRYRAILRENISLSVLPASRQVSNESRLPGRMGGENVFECKLFSILNSKCWSPLYTL